MGAIRMSLIILDIIISNINKNNIMDYLARSNSLKLKVS